MSQNFNATRPGITIAVGTGVSVIELPLSEIHGVDALIDNRGAFDAYLLFGGPDVTTTIATGARVPAGALGVYGKGSATHVAVIGDGATSLVMHFGQGV